MRTAKLGTVSSGTMRTKDLVQCFYRELKSLGGKVKGGTKYAKLRNLANGVPDSYWDSEDANWDLEALFNALDEHAPPFAYFGSHDGDGAHYGFWLSWGSIKDAEDAGE